MKPLSVFGISVLTALGAAPASHAASLAFGIGIRETGSNVGIGENGGATGGIEHVNRAGVVVADNNQWQTISIHLPTATIAPFAGATADGSLSAANNQGVLENISIGVVDSAGPFEIYFDNLTYTDAAGATTVIADWEGFADGTEVVFRLPGFSGSTSTHVDLTTDTAGTAGGGAGNGSDGAYGIGFSFVDTDPTRWVRLTTSGTGTTPNPAIGLNGTVSFDVRIVPEPAAAGLLALAGLSTLRRRR